MNAEKFIHNGSQGYRCKACGKNFPGGTFDDVHYHLKTECITFGFYEGECLVLGKVADFLMSETPIITNIRNNQVWLWNVKENVWVNTGENLLKIRTKELLLYVYSDKKMSEILGHIRAKTFKDIELLTPSTNLIPLQNGIFDLQKKTLLSFSHEYFFTHKLPIKYEPIADCPKIKQFFADIVYPSDIPILFELCGYCLYRDYPIQKEVMLLGAGSNGKSVFLSLLRSFLGAKNISAKTLQELEDNRFAIANLRDKYANIFSDLPAKAFRGTSIQKALTGGDYVSGDIKFAPTPTDFVNAAKLIFSANKLPETPDDSDAFYRRWVLISFPFTFSDNGVDGTKKADKSILTQLTTEAELSGLFNRAIAALETLLINGAFSNSQGVDYIRKQYVRLSSPVAFFIEEQLQFEPTAYTTREALHNAFLQFCGANKLPQVSEKRFFSQLYEKIGAQLADERRTIDGVRKRGFVGLQLKAVQDVHDFQNKLEESNTSVGLGVQDVQLSSYITPPRSLQGCPLNGKNRGHAGQGNAGATDE